MSAVTHRHIEFAQALVRLAREHGMDNIAVSFRDSIRAIPPGQWLGSGTLNVTWAEGRHGEKNSIRIRHEAETQVDEATAWPVSLPTEPAVAEGTK
jgi:hypothetical protein